MRHHENVRADIASRLEKLRTLDKLAEEMSSPRRGNGWDSSKLAESVMRVVPQPLDKLARKAIRPGITRGIVDLFRPPSASSRLAGPPTLVYFPLWYVKGYHECYYLRDAKYKIRVSKDVVAVELDGKTRDLMIEEQEASIVPEVFKRRLKRFSGLFTSDSRCFYLDEAVELAVRYEEAEFYVAWDGREGKMLEEVLPKGWRTQRIFEVGQLDTEGTATRIASSAETKETIIDRFRSRLVKVPENSRHLLSNMFQVDELTEYYYPYSHFPILRGGKIDHVILDAGSAQIPNARTIDFVKRQLSLRN